MSATARRAARRTPASAPRVPDLLSRLATDLPAVAGDAPAALLGAIVDGRPVITTRGPAHDESVFELGSITKTFTGLLLAIMARRGEVALDDPIGDHLPAVARPRRPAAAAITLESLATHTSGLPRVPINSLPRAIPHLLTNPYAGYRTRHLHRATARTRPRVRTDGRARYSNFGVGLLGHLLGVVADSDYATLVDARICRPLGLRHTRAIQRPGDLPGYRRGRATPPWQMGASLAGAGALRASAHDLGIYLSALLDAGPHHAATGHHLAARTPVLPEDLATALVDVQRPRARLDATTSVALGWHHRTLRSGDVLFHGGATCGQNGFVGVHRNTGIAVIALASTAHTLRSPLQETAYKVLIDLVAERATRAVSAD